MWTQASDGSATSNLYHVANLLEPTSEWKMLWGSVNSLYHEQDTLNQTQVIYLLWQREESIALIFFLCSTLWNPANKRTKSSILFTIRFILFAECSLCSICVRHFFSLLFLLAMRKVGCCSLVRSKIQDRRNKYNKLKKCPFLRFKTIIAKVPDNRKQIDIWAVSGELWARYREWCCMRLRENEVEKLTA